MFMPRFSLSLNFRILTAWKQYKTRSQDTASHTHRIGLRNYYRYVYMYVCMLQNDKNLPHVHVNLFSSLNSLFLSLNSLSSSQDVLIVELYIPEQFTTSDQGSFIIYQLSMCSKLCKCVCATCSFLQCFGFIHAGLRYLLTV